LFPPEINPVMAGAATIVYNNTNFSVTPAIATYQHEVTDLVTTDPSGGAYDYKLHVVCDLNAVLDDFTYFRDLLANEHTATGESSSWGHLHALLSTGTSTNMTPVAGDSFETTMSDGDTSAIAKWDLFWAGLLSECIDSDDKAGLSVKTTTMEQRTDYPTNIGSYVDLAGANTANFINDITGGINDAFGSTETTGAVGALSISDQAFGTKVIQTAPASATNFLVAAVILFFHTYGHPTLSGDPTDAPVKFALAEGDGFGIRISASITNTLTGLITVVQNSP
jgi:hypothetical protein